MGIIESMNLNSFAIAESSERRDSGLSVPRDRKAFRVTTKLLVLACVYG
jgi:hypothetical protein